MSINTNKTSLLSIKTRKKNDFVALEEGAYPQMFIEQVYEAIEAVSTNRLSRTKMVKRHKRSNALTIKMGYGERLAWFENDLIPQKRYAECGSAEEAIQALHTIRKAAEAGEFDEALEALRIRRQEHARKMMDARNSCGFHPAPHPKEPQTEKMLLLPAPTEFPMEPINVGPIIQTEAR